MSKKKKHFFQVFLEGLMDWNSKRRKKDVPMERVTNYTNGEVAFGDVFLHDEEDEEVRYVQTYYD